MVVSAIGRKMYQKVQRCWITVIIRLLRVLWILIFNGFAGYDVMDNSEESLLGMSQALLSAGVTSFLPTALTAPFEELKLFAKLTTNMVGKETGAKIQGTFSLRDLISLKPIRGLKILYTWAIQEWNN